MRHGRLPFSLLLMQHLVACTLTSEPFNPEAVAESRGVLDAGVVEPGPAPAPAPAKEDDAGVINSSCSNTELPGCALSLVAMGGECRSDRECMSGACVSGACALRSQSCRGEGCPGAGCGDGMQSSGEKGVDCGGPCRACAAAPSCTDGVKNQDETAVDCGGPCQACPPTCVDGVKNGTEPVIDCGNATCGLCALGSPCARSEQCATGLCQAGSCKPLPCADGEKTGTETDVDCGGSDPSCPRCLPNRRCAGNGDCVDGVCVAGSCNTCGDGLQNGGEAGIDCGGACPACPGQACGTDAACASGVCDDGRCCGGTLGDCTRCARRLARGGINCDTNGPEASNDCNSFLQCLADNPDVCTRRLAPGCTDEAPEGVCAHTSFGGNAGPGVRLADAILGTAECSF